MGFKILIHTFFILILSCGVNKTSVIDNDNSMPDWINNYKKDYPNNRYISYLSVSDIKSMAEKQAMIGITSQFKVDIKSKINSQEKITETSDSFDRKYSVNEDIEMVSDQELKNIKISETYSDVKNNKFYVLATLDKIETYRIYTSELSKLESDFKSYYDNFQKENNIIEKYKSINRCIELENQIRLINYKLDVLGGPKPRYSSYDNLILTRSKLANELTFNIENENQNIYLSLKNSVTKQGFKIVYNNAELNIKYIYNISESSIKNKSVIFVNWDITINVIEVNRNNILFSYKKKGRSSQKTLDSAMERAYYDIDRDIVENFSEYLNKNL